MICIRLCIAYGYMYDIDCGILWILSVVSWPIMITYKVLEMILCTWHKGL